MEKSLVNKYITNRRIKVYDDIENYKLNLQKSKNAYIPLSVLEVSLRNSINTLFERLYTRGWILNEADFLKQKELKKIYEAKNSIKERGEILTKEKLVAELTFGFWTGLFQSAYKEKMRFNNLKQIFPNLPPKEVLEIDRKQLSSKLNHIRKFRNRVFHHENILKDEFLNIENDINEVLTFFHEDICKFTKEINNK